MLASLLALGAIIIAIGGVIQFFFPVSLFQVFKWLKQQISESGKFRLKARLYSEPGHIPMPLLVVIIYRDERTLPVPTAQCAEKRDFWKGRLESRKHFVKAMLNTIRLMFPPQTYAVVEIQASGKSTRYNIVDIKPGAQPVIPEERIFKLGLDMMLELSTKS